MCRQFITDKPFIKLLKRLDAGNREVDASASLLARGYLLINGLLSGRCKLDIIRLYTAFRQALAA